jgi:hypothetical protein
VWIVSPFAGAWRSLGGMTSETYTLRLAGGALLTAVLDLERFDKTEQPDHILKIQLQGRIASNSELAASMAWTHALNLRIAKLIDRNHLYVFAGCTPPRAFVYHPDGTYEEEIIPPEVQRAFHGLTP